jgi:hypothetical protein
MLASKADAADIGRGRRPVNPVPHCTGSWRATMRSRLWQLRHVPLRA